MKTPIALIIFNRPEHTERVFEAIRQAQPPQLLVIADGPRSHRPDDTEKCAATRAIIDRVDWDCEVLKNFSDTNLGCGIRPATGISWVFDMVEEAIVLEDDCIPDPSFFPYCDELLERYRDDERIAHISGNNFCGDRYQLDDSYFFSRYALTWGWATWRRAWQYYDFDIKLWLRTKQRNLLQDIFSDPHTVATWTRIFQDVTDGKIDAWDFQWILACWLQNGLAILPNVNLVSNIGFGADATHTFSAESTAVDDLQLSLATEAINFPLKHANVIIPDTRIDRFIQDALYDYFPKLPKRLQLKLKRILAKKSGY